MTGTARLGMTTHPTREEPLMTTTAWPTLPPVEMVAFAYDGWSILRVGATATLPLTYEATHPELPGDVFVEGSLGEVRDLIDMYRELVEEQAQEAEAAAYAAWEPEQDALCKATRHAETCNHYECWPTPDGMETFGATCGKAPGHAGQHGDWVAE